MNTRIGRIAPIVMIAATLICVASCGGGPSTYVSGSSTYVYVGQSYVPSAYNSAPVGSVAQFKMESNGTLTMLKPPTISSVVPVTAL